MDFFGGWGVWEFGMKDEEGERREEGFRYYDIG